MSNPYVINVTLKNNQIVLTIRVDEFQPGESLEISGHATQNGGAFAIFYDIQVVPEHNPDGTAYMYVKASPLRQFMDSNDVTVVLRAARVWSTVLQKGQGGQTPPASLTASTSAATPAQDGTTWSVVKAVGSPDTGLSPGWNAGPAAAGSEASFPGS